MKKEVEIKILNIDPKKLKNKIIKLGGKQILKLTLFREFYLDSPIKNRKYSSFRIRSEGKKCFLTIKTKKDDNKFEIRNEHEVSVSNEKIIQDILSIAGFKIFRKREKKRESFLLNDIKIEIDTYPQMNPYVEIEGKNKKEIMQIIKKLDFSFKYANKKTATEIIKDAGLNPDNLVF